jgi:hypothetical protein
LPLRWQLAFADHKILVDQPAVQYERGSLNSLRNEQSDAFSPSTRSDNGVSKVSLQSSQSVQYKP